MYKYMTIRVFFFQFYIKLFVRKIIQSNNFISSNFIGDFWRSFINYVKFLFSNLDPSPPGRRFAEQLPSSRKIFSKACKISELSRKKNSSHKFLTRKIFIYSHPSLPGEIWRDSGRPLILHRIKIKFFIMNRLLRQPEPIYLQNY